MNLTILFQRIEGLTIALGAAYLYQRWGGNWLLFLPLWLAIDLSIIGYLVGPKVGAYVYNIGHTLVVPLALLAVGTMVDSAVIQLLSMIWFAHVGVDRALGYGLKHPDSFQHTHLGTMGRPKQ